MLKHNKFNKTTITANAIQAYVAYRDARDAWENLKPQIRAYMDTKGLDLLQLDDGVIKLVDVAGRENFKRALFQKDHPQLYKKYSTEGKPTQRLDVFPNE